MLMFRRCRSDDMVLLNGCISRMGKRAGNVRVKCIGDRRGRDCMICMNITLETEYPIEEGIYPSSPSPLTQASSP